MRVIAVINIETYITAQSAYLISSSLRVCWEVGTSSVVGGLVWSLSILAIKRSLVSWPKGWDQRNPTQLSSAY
jgi:hypothetical protein